MGEQRIAEMFVELADTLVDDFDVVEFLQVVTERCIELSGATAAVLMLVDDRGGLKGVATTSTFTRETEFLELVQGEGPWSDCYATGEAIVDVVIAETCPEVSHGWPQFAHAATEAGLGSASAFPMRWRDRVIGTLNLFSDRQDSMPPSSLALTQAVADIATIGLLQDRSPQAQTGLAEQQQVALQSRVVIEQAKGALAARADISVAEAFTRIRRHARTNRIALTIVAEAVVSARLCLNADGSPTPRSERTVSAPPASQATTGPGPTGVPPSPGPNTRGTSGATVTSLTEEDRAILRLVSAGLPASAVADCLGLTLLQVAQRLQAIRVRLQVDSTAAAVREAIRIAWCEQDELSVVHRWGPPSRMINRRAGRLARPFPHLGRQACGVERSNRYIT